MAVHLSSDAFSEGSTIPKQHTCDGENISPEIRWINAPEDASSYVLIMDDPDAPAGTWVHWVIYNISPETKELAGRLPKTYFIEGIGTQGINNFHKIGYDGPCPPKGKPHRYFFKFYALDVILNLEPGSTKASIEKMMQGHILAEGQLMGLYGR